MSRSYALDFSDEYLARLWQEINWEKSEQKLADYQAKLTKAAFRGDTEEIGRIQKKLVRDLDIKYLAVRHVANSGSGPGIDCVRWKTDAQKMRAALSLTSKDYHAKPLRQIIMVSKNTGKERRTGLPTYYDKAMNVLYGYSLIPVLEAQAERKSFAFRPARSAQDALAYILDCLKGKNAPTVVAIADIRAYFKNIQHTWLLQNVPMDKKVLREFLNVGIVFAGELFPPEDTGISEGSNLSPYLGNYVLDGLQKYMYRGLFGTETPMDFDNGNLIRFADDILITTRTKGDAEKALKVLREFLSERGLALSEEKTMIRTVEEGFDFLSETIVKRGKFIYSYPSEKAIDRFITEIKETISTYKKSQRSLITLLNQKLRGWANYHKFSDAEDAFRRVDTAVQTALLEAALAKHPKMDKSKVIAKYWYKEPDGTHSYCLPQDKSVKVIRLADTVLIHHQKIKTNANPFLDTDYVETRTHEREINNVSGSYRAIWERQGGLCYYCGRPILPDHPRTTVVLDLDKPPSVKNSAYIHKLCQANQLEVIQVDEADLLHPYDVLAALEGIQEQTTRKEGKGREKRDLTPKWKYWKLKEYLGEHDEATIIITFKEIEEIVGVQLPPTARVRTDWWYPRIHYNTIAEAWVTEGYSLDYIDLIKEKIKLKRSLDGYSKLIIPKALTSGKIPNNAIFELEQFFEYIVKKYAL